MPTVRDLWAASAAKGGMEMTLEFEYDEHVAVVMAAFRERTRTPHASMPLVHRVDVLREHDGSFRGWSTRKRRFFTHNDAPEWVRRISGGDYLVGIERIEWNDAEGRMRMYTVNESHAEKIVAEELCVIKRHPRDASRTVKTLTVRARLCIRGWWTLGLSTLAERFLLGRYELLVQQGKKIELDEIERWRVSGRADAARRRAETEKTALLLATSATLSESAFPESAQSALQTRKLSPSVLNARARTQDSPVSTLRRGVSAASVDTADGLGVESLEAFERSLLSSPSSATFPSPVGAESDLFDAREEDWLSMRYEGGFRTPQSAYAAGPALATTEAEENTFVESGKGVSLKTTALAGTASQSPPPRDDDDDDAFFSPLHVPLEEVEEAEDASEDASEDAESDSSASDAFERSRTRDSGTVEETERTVALRAREKSAATKNAVSRTPAEDDDDDDDDGGGGVNGDSDVGTPGAAARRFLSPPSAADERRVRRSASLKKKSLKKSLLLDEKVSALEKEKEDEIARRFGLETFEERAAARSLAWRRAVVRFASCCALAAVAHERREALEPLTSRLRSAAVAANRKLGMGRKKEAKRLSERIKAPTKTSRGAGAERRDEIAEVGAVGFDSAADLDGERTLVAFTPPSAEA
jgi:hypothetical protein